MSEENLYLNDFITFNCRLLLKSAFLYQQPKFYGQIQHNDKVQYFPGYLWLASWGSLNKPFVDMLRDGAVSVDSKG